MNDARISVKALLFYMMALFICLIYTMPENIRNITEYVFSIFGVGIWIVNQRRTSLSISASALKSKWIQLCCVLLIMITLFQIVAPNGGHNALICTGELLACVTYATYPDNLYYRIPKYKAILKALFYIMSCALLFFLVVRINAGITSEISRTTLFYVFGRDKNKLGLLVFSYFVFCLKNDFKAGYILSVIMAINCGSRMLFLALLCVGIVYLYNWITTKKGKKRKNIPERIANFIVKPGWYFLFEIIFISLFSLGFVAWCQTNGYSEYMSQLVDGSNYMRMVSNVYAIRTIISDPSYILWGLDGRIFEALGIESENMYLHTRYLGVRLVTPENDILNLVLRSGLLYTMIYWYILSHTIKRYDYLNNVPLLIPFTCIYSMFLRPVLCRGELIILVFILSIYSAESVNSLSSSTK